MTSPFAKIPSVNVILDHLADVQDRIDSKFLKVIIDRILADLKAQPKKYGLEKKDRDTILQDIISRVMQQINTILSPSFTHVINATGVILHTGLGRAPLGHSSVEMLKSLATYTNLEIQVTTGKRGERLEHVAPLLRLLTGAEDAVVVNNNAAAVLLMLNSVARRKEVIVSRGELVEIGGSFRMPEVMKTSGAKMVEIGATNKTHLSDYAQAITPRTAAIMLVHPSNYMILGFSAKPELPEIIAVAHEHDIPVLYDVGSGALVDMQKFGLEYEPVVEDIVKLGVDLITFSGDKLLGGPQAGIIVGKSKWIKKVKQNHLLRALRCDKMSLATMAQALRGYLNFDRLMEQNTSLQLFDRKPDQQKKLADLLVQNISQSTNIVPEIISVFGKVGSGAYPLAKIPAVGIKLSSQELSAEKIARSLRQHKTPVFGFIENDEFILNMLTVFEDEIEIISEAINRL